MYSLIGSRELKTGGLEIVWMVASVGVWNFRSLVPFLPLLTRQLSMLHESHRIVGRHDLIYSPDSQACSSVHSLRVICLSRHEYYSHARIDRWRNTQRFIHLLYLIVDPFSGLTLWVSRRSWPTCRVQPSMGWWYPWRFVVAPQFLRLLSIETTLKSTHRRHPPLALSN